MITIAICDDDVSQINALKKLLTEWNSHITISEFHSAEQFLFSYSDTPCDLLLLDIEMDGMNGMELARKLRNKGDMLPIIFITGYSEFMQDGYDVEALHYLLKPVDKDKLFAVLDRYASRHIADSRVILHSGEESVCVNANDIMYLEAFGKKTQIMLKDSKEIICTCGISTATEKLGKGFVSCHRSYVVNIGYVRSISKTEITLDNGKKIPLSRRLYDSVNKAFISYYSLMNNDGGFMKTAIIIICIAVVITALFFLFRKLFYHLVDKRIEQFQSDLISKQTAEIQNMYRQMQEWRHDYRNHIQNMKNRLDCDNGELEQYLDDLADDLTQADTSIKTGNVMADAVLNSKLSVAEQKGIQLNVKAHIPQGTALTDVELCSMLGNLLDNAMEACEKLPVDERFIRVYIDKFKGQFYLSVQNSSPVVQRDRGIFRTTKSGTHGFGLFRIDRIAKKYGGYVNRQYEEGIFATELLLPLTG